MPIELLRKRLVSGLVIPACPLALNSDGSWSESYQRCLARYYCDAQAGGIAVGVHSTQFAIREPAINLFRPVLECVSNELDAWQGNTPQPMVKIAGICGELEQALPESKTAIELGYDAGLVSMTALNRCPESEILEHCHQVSKVIPVVGFYLQPAVGGRVFSYEFWQRFCEIPNLVAIKIAPFNRYQTIDVMRAVVCSGRNDVALYTGNDDHIIGDLITPFQFEIDGETRTRFFDGGLLGQWGVWTRRAVELLDEIRLARKNDTYIDQKWLLENVKFTDANAAIFDAANGFAGCIPGILEILKRQGLVPSNRCLDPDEQLSPGQAEELSRVVAAYPELTDDEFVQSNRDRWLAGR